MSDSPHPVYLPGLRNLKTALAVLIILILAKLMEYPLPIYAGIAAITTMQDSIAHSISYGKMRIMATLVGGFVSIVVLYSARHLPVAGIEMYLVAVGIVLTILLCNIIRFKEASGLAAVVYFIIVMQYTGNPYTYAMIRTAETIVGIIIAVFINHYVKRPKSAPEA
jgi:uncharacterized membrane protein YgaE (UPF0421/DUF939 family)